MELETKFSVAYAAVFIWKKLTTDSDIEAVSITKEKDMSIKIITSESVGIGHPDKTCDVIADSFLDAALAQDPHAQMAVECAIKDDLLMIYGEATTTAKVDYEAIAKKILKEIGYSSEFRVVKQISVQSPDIHQAVVKEELCANDQGIVYGYACSDTPEKMPLPILLAHKLMKQYDQYRKTNPLKFFPDAKSQVSVNYENGKPIGIHTVLVSVSHAGDVSHKEIEETVREQIISPVFASFPPEFTKGMKLVINPSGKFTVWGSFSDSGCVGRKIVVDTYGGVGRVGGGCFSSKNASKVDRSGAYYARYAAKNIVAHGLADRCEIQVAYGIGLAEPISIYVKTFGTNHVPEAEIDAFVKQNFCFRPAAMIAELGLLRPIYKPTACYGHFGREEFAWEQIKRINQ